jgi:hypothetical protein
MVFPGDGWAVPLAVQAMVVFPDGDVIVTVG